MKKILVGTVVIALAFAGLSAVPAQAATAWDNFAADVAASSSGGTLIYGSLVVSSDDGTSDSTIAIHHNLIIEANSTSTLASFFDAPMFTIDSGVTLEIETNGTVALQTHNHNQPVFGGAGSVSLMGGTGFSAAPIAFGGSVQGSVSTGTTLSLGGSLATGTAVVTNHGTISSSGGAVDVPSGVTLNQESQVSGATMTVAGQLINTGTIQLVGAFAVSSGGSVMQTATGSIASPGTLVNAGTIYGDGIVTVGTGVGTLQNDGTIIPSAMTINATVTDHNYVIGYTTTGSEAAIPSTHIYAATFHDILATIPWPTDTTSNFLGWKMGSVTLSDTTDLATYATSGGTTAVTEMNGDFSTISPVATNPFTGFIGTVGGSATYVYKVDGTQVQSSSSALYTLRTSDVGGDLSLDVQVTMPSGYDPGTKTYSNDFGTVMGHYTAVGSMTLTGLQAVGSTLIADASAVFTPVPSYTCKWERIVGGTPVDVGTGPTYVLTAADEGFQMEVDAIASLPNYLGGEAGYGFGPIAAQPVVTLSSSDVNAGDTITVSVPGLEANTDYTVDLHSSPVVLGVLHSSGAGLISGSFVIPSNTATAVHSIVILDPRGNPVTSATLLVTGVGLASTGALVSAAPIAGGWVLGLGVLLVVVARRRRRA